MSSSKMNRNKNPDNYNFNCFCGKNFSSKKNFNAHKRKNHKDQYTNTALTSKTKNCPLCPFISHDSCDLTKHYEINHDIALAREKFEFASKDLFLAWKDKMEARTVAKYSTIRGPVVFKNHKTHRYTCHRSGYYIPSGKGSRHLKLQGSAKINAFCPASITVKEQNDGTCLVLHISTHVGHKCELKHIQLSAAERDNIARKIALEIPFDGILNEIRDSIDDSKLERKHLLTRQDLYNIEASFNLSSKAVTHKDDVTRVDAWVKEMEADGNCILYYKPQGVYLSEMPAFKLQDFILIIMTSAQMDILKQYGSDCVCLDGTHGVNGYSFELTTLLVLDELQEGFPCAFLISNRSDTEVLKLFFSQIKLQAGVIKSNVFMSDMADTFFNAWIHVMGVPNKRLYCAWHVDDSWRRNLPNINGKENQATIYKQLQTLIMEQDVNAFHKMLSEFSNIDDPDCAKFIEYFNSYFVPKCEYWANCYHINAGINTNMHLERMHRSIKYIYLKEKNVKRLDKGIAGIMSFLRDKLINKLIVVNKGKLCSKVTTIRNRHNNMQRLDPSKIIKSNNANTLKNGQICDEVSNKLSIESTENDDNNMIIDEDSDEDITNTSNCEPILQELSKKRSKQNFLQAKEDLIKMYLESLNSISTLEELNYMKQYFLPINPTLAAIKESNLKSSYLKTMKASQKNIVPQRQLFSTNKKKK